MGASEQSQAELTEPTGTRQWGFIGSGKMATALIRGMLRSGVAGTATIAASDPLESARAGLAADTGVRVAPLPPGLSTHSGWRSMPKHVPGGDALQESATRIAKLQPRLAAERRARPARRTRQIITLETLNATSVAISEFDDLDFAALDEPREPEKWY